MICPSSAHQSLVKLGLEKKWFPAFRVGNLQPEPSSCSQPLCLHSPFFCPVLSLCCFVLLSSLESFLSGPLQLCSDLCACVRVCVHTRTEAGVFLLEVCYFWKAL